MDPVSQFLQLALFAVFAFWFVSLPALGLLAWSLALITNRPHSEERRRAARCYWLLLLAPASLGVAVTIGHHGPPVEWPAWIDVFVPAVTVGNMLLGLVLVVRARGVRIAAMIVVIASVLLSLVFASAGLIALTGVGP